MASVPFDRAGFVCRVYVCIDFYFRAPIHQIVVVVVVVVAQLDILKHILAC